MLIFDFSDPCKTVFCFVIYVSDRNSLFVPLEIHGILIILGHKNRLSIINIGTFTIENIQIELVHCLDCIFGHSCFPVLDTQFLPPVFQTYTL